MSPVYDAGYLVAADRGDRSVWADHRARLELGVLPATTAPVIAQVSRSPRQAQLRRLLRGCTVVPFDAIHAHLVGELLGRSRTADVVDAHVALTASERGATVHTSDVADLSLLSRHLPRPVVVGHVGGGRRRRQP